MSSEKILENELENETEEERIIKSLVDDIYEYEEKILEINSFLEKNTSDYKYDENIINLKKKENEVKDKINLIKIQNNDEINKKQNIINVKQNILNNIEKQLNEYINKLTTFNTLSFSSLTMTKYIISNNINEFLTKEQINDIINNSIQQNQNNNIINLNNKEVKNNFEKEINEEINIIKDNINQLNENLMMMKEEKKIVNNEIIELISCKETIDSLVKTSLNNLNDFNNNFNNKNEKSEENENNSDENTNIILPEIYSYELNLLDTNKTSKNICDELYDVFNIKNSELNNINSNKKINKNMINNNEYNDIEEEYNKELSLNLSEIKSNKEEDNFNKNNLEILIKSELDTFLLNEIKNKEIINNLLENLCIIVTTKLQLLDIDNISSEKLKIFFLYYFKSIYYDNIIENKLKFINKEYKILKKEIKKNLESLKNELNILENKKEEMNINKENNKTKMKYLYNDNYNNMNEEPVNLTKSEQEYIQICSKGNSLLKQKEELINIINELERNIEKIKIKNEEEIYKMTIELNKIKEKINSLTNNEEKTKIKLNDDILNYRKIISDKFELIKKQLQKYKSKYGSSLGIYNRLIDGINDTIKQTCNNNVNEYEFEKKENKKDEINKIINSIGIKDSENYNNINSKNNNLNINENLINKLIPLTKNTVCYYREIKNISNKFNPIEDNISIGNLTENPYNFIKCIILLNKTYNGINFISSNFNYNYNLNQIDNTIMNSNLKIIIEIHRDYRKYKSTNKNNNSNSINDFIKKEKLKYFNYDNNFIEKCALNEYYNFSLLINKNKRIEIVLCSYEDFKLWINGFAFIIKNKKLLMNTK